VSSPRRRSKTQEFTGVVGDDSTPSEVIAHEVVTRYNDLAPSVRRIMEADLDEAGRLHAISLFRDSLGAANDPMRNPQNAIGAARPAPAE